MARELLNIVRMLLSADSHPRAMSIPTDALPSTDLAPVVSRGLPWHYEPTSLLCPDDRLFLFSRCVPDRRKLSIASSRIGLRLDLETWWFDLLRTSVLHCREADEILVTAEGSSTCEAVRRAAELFEKPRLHFRPMGRGAIESEDDALKWLTAALRYLDSEEFTASASTTILAIVSPPLDSRLIHPNLSADTASVDQLGLTDIPLADQLQVAASQRTYVLSLRKNGHIQSLLDYRLRQSTGPWHSILIASDAEGRLPDATMHLPAGWIPWLVEPCELQNPEITPHFSERNGYAIPTIRRPGPIRRPESDPVSNPEEWLLHWTRPATGPWPDESPDDYLDSLILRTERVHRSALATLLRIVTDGVLRGSSKGVRGGYSVVSLTAVPLSEFRQRRSFRNHLHRFDFEPWGIGFRRSAIAGLVREVIYGTDADWLRLSDQDRPYFQRATTGGATNNVAEREWRALGELAFQHMDSDDVCVFAPTQDDAELLAQHCRWGIVITP